MPCGKQKQSHELLQLYLIMRKKIYCLPLVIIVMIMAMTSCSTKSTDCAKYIPDDALAVIRIDVEQLSKKCGDGGEQLKSKMLEAISKDSKSTEAREKLKEIFDDPAETGIDLRVPVMTYIKQDDRNNEFGLVAAVRDKDKLTDLLNATAESESEKVKTEDDINYVYTGEKIMAYNSEVLCIKKFGRVSEAEAVADMKKLINGEYNYTFGESEAMKKMVAAKGVAQCLITGKVLTVAPEFREMRDMLPEELDLKDVANLLDLTMDKGEAALKFEFITSSDKWKDYMKKTEEAYRPIDSDLLEYASADGLAIVINPNGEKILSMMKEQGVNKTINDSNMEMVANVLSSIDGNIVISGLDFNFANPNLNVYAKTKDGAIAGILGMMFGNTFAVGYKDGVTYLLTQAGAEPFKSEKNTIKKSDAKGKRGYLRFNFESLKTNSNIKREAEIIAGSLDKFEISLEGDGKGEMRLTLRDKDKYPIEAISKIVTDFLN